MMTALPAVFPAPTADQTQTDRLLPAAYDPSPHSPLDPTVRPRIDQGRFWTGAALTAGVAALTGVVSLVVAHVITHQQILSAADTPISIGGYGLTVALIALVTAALFDGIAHAAPRPTLYFGWLGGLGVALAAVLPFTTGNPLLPTAIFAGVNILVGISILVLVPVAATSARRTR